MSSTSNSDNKIVDLLASFPDLQEVPRGQLEWLVRESRPMTWEKGTVISKPSDIFDDMITILEGAIQGYTLQQNQKKIQTGSEPGTITGQLPFSRMKFSPIYVEAMTPISALLLHKSKFKDLVAQNYELTAVIIHAMVDRARHFTSLHFQNEKLMSLGKLSAGLAHELNNPAAAIVRSADDLRQTNGSLFESLRTIASIQLTASELSCLDPILEKAEKKSPERKSLLERKRLEDEVTSWLEDNNILADYAETFTDFDITPQDLDGMKRAVSERAFRPLIDWLAERLQAEKAVHEIGTAAKRISELVQSVKSYTRMDQVQDMQEVQINEGIRNTITMLQYKARKNSVEVKDDLANDLPLISGFPGELNQIWTNIIDNAIDAMKSGGELDIKTFALDGKVVFNAIDNGPGIAPENLERIFDPFFTTKDIGEGTGVGLDVVQKVIQLHKGTIDVNSRPGRTEFLVSFPRLQPA
jgi:signal transduction histidine kinase